MNDLERGKVLIPPNILCYQLSIHLMNTLPSSQFFKSIKNENMAHIQRPLTLPKHPVLLHEINQTIIAVKVWYLIKEGQDATPEQIDKVRAHNPRPTWDDIAVLLRKAYDAINEQREDPRRY